MIGRILGDGLLLLSVLAGLGIGSGVGHLASGLVVGTGIGLVLRGVSGWAARGQIRGGVGLVCLGVFMALAAPLYQIGSVAGERDRALVVHPLR